MRGVNSGNMNSAWMATVTAVTFVVTFAPLLRGLAQKTGVPLTGDCSAGQTGRRDVNVTEADTTVTLKCKQSTKVTPTFTERDFKVCIEEDCSSPKLLSDLISGATGTKVNDETATVAIKGLPSSAQTFYVQCGDKPQACYIVVKVDSSKPAVSGPGGEGGSTGGVTPGSLLSCADPGKAITIKLPEEGSTAQFTCGSLTLYPAATDRVFAEDCKKEESLKNIVRSVRDTVYTLTAGKKPPKKKLCYLCAKSDVSAKNPGKPSDYCLVHVESSSRTQSTSSIALAAMLPCVLAMLRIT